MSTDFFAQLRVIGTAALFLFTAVPAGAEAAHGIAMYGQPALPPDFVSLPYANPQAPKGGRIAIGVAGGFDSLNPFILKGVAPAGVAALTVETLLGRSYDEPFSLYGLLAESVSTDAARTYVEFTLRDGARFADGTPVTVADVIWSFEKLGTEGTPRYAGAWKKIADITQTGPRSVRFTFNTPDRELPLILGLRPILSKADWAVRDFGATTLTPVLGSGPYVVDKVAPGRFITYRRNPDWWGRNLPFNQGLHNFDEVRYDYFGDAGVMFEAFKAGAITTWREGNPAKWLTNYDFPAVRSGDIVRSEIPHHRPSGIEGFVFNTRKPMFADWRVRQALIEVFDFEAINATLNGGATPRIASYFSNSALAAPAGTPATGRVLELLAPFRDALLPGTVEGYALPVSDGTQTNRKALRRAIALLEEAGLTLRDGVLHLPDGTPFTFEILLANGASDMAAAANIYAESLRRLGVNVRVTSIDAAQLNERTKTYDFDMTHYVRALSLSPGNEQMLYWGSAGVDAPGTGNWMGMRSAPAEAMIATLLQATDHADFVAAVQALDRILIAGRYVVPIWYSDIARLAHAKTLHFPQKLPLYGDWLGFQPEVWWYQE